MAACGHLACNKCWTKWLVKSESCPKCRATVAKEQLTRVAFQKERLGGTKIPMTLSQLCRANEDSGSSDEDELEVVGAPTDPS
jgi:hypothetical protein